MKKERYCFCKDQSYQEVYPRLGETFQFLSFFFFFFKIHLFIFTAVLGLCSCAWAFSSCGKQRLLSSCCVEASHFCGFSCCRAQALGTWGSVVTVCGLSSCGSRALEC